MQIQALTKYAEACLKENLSIVAMDGDSGELLGEFWQYKEAKPSALFNKLC